MGRTVREQRRVLLPSTRTPSALYDNVRSAGAAELKPGQRAVTDVSAQLHHIDTHTHTHPG